MLSSALYSTNQDHSSYMDSNFNSTKILDTSKQSKTKEFTSAKKSMASRKSLDYDTVESTRYTTSKKESRRNTF